MNDDTRERMIALEVEVRHLREAINELRIEGSATRVAVSEMRDLLTQARGARWALVTLVGLAGFLSAWAPSLAKWLGVIR